MTFHPRGRNCFLLPNTAGEKSRTRKLTAAQVAEIRRLRATQGPESSSRKLGKRFGVSQTQILKIVRGVAWIQTTEQP